jgi:hypothetical protein
MGGITNIKPVLAGIGALGLVSVAACGTAAASPGITTSASSAPASSAPASSTPSPSGTAALALAQNEQAWCSATGGSDMAAVVTDLNNLSTDLNNDSLTGIATDGGDLYYDADTAWYDTVPSIDSADYQNAMNDYTVAGVGYSSADITDGNASLNAGAAAYSSWVAAVTAAGSVCTGNYYEPGFDLTASGSAASTPVQAPLPWFTCGAVINAPAPYGSGLFTLTISINGNGPDNAYSQAILKVTSGSWSQTVTMTKSSGWRWSANIPPAEGDGCSVTTESAS